MSHAGLVEVFEQACRDAQVASTRVPAEETLKSLFSHRDVIPLALAVLEFTNSPLARFHAAAALHSAARDRWNSLQPAQRVGQGSLRYWIINKVISNPSLVTFERRALLRTAAFLARRAYLEESQQDRDAFLYNLQNIATSQGSPQHVVVAAVELIHLIVEEFLTPSVSLSSSAIERELLIRTRDKFAAPSGDIVRLLQIAKDTLSLLLAGTPNGLPTPDWEARAAPALSAIIKIVATDPKLLSTSLQEKSSSSLESDMIGSSTATLEAVVIKRFEGPEWVSLIHHISELTKLCFSIISMQLQARETNPESLVLLRATQAVIAISAISQASYGQADTAARDVLTELLTQMDQQRWCSCHFSVIRLAYAEVWKRISCAFGLVQLENLSQNWVKKLARDTCIELEATASRLSNPEDDDNIFSLDVVDILLETWVNLALQGDDPSSTDHRLSPYIENVITHFLRTFLRSSGEAPAVIAYAKRLDSEEDLGFEDTSIDDSRLSVAASLARYVLDRLAEKVSQCLIDLSHKVSNWNSGISSLPNALSVFQEDLFFLIHFTGALLADEAKGEVPSIPSQFVRSLTGLETKKFTKHGMQVRLLLHALMEAAQAESYTLQKRGVYSEEASPRIGTALLDNLFRVSRTYLVPEDVSSAATAAQLIGGHQYLESSINLCFQKAAEGLLQRSFESEVTKSASFLLSHLAHGATAYQYVQESQYWQRFMERGVEIYQTLPVKAVREVGRSLTTVVGDMMADTFLRPAYNALRGFAGAQNKMADAAERAIATVNLLGGAARSEKLGSRTRGSLLQSLEVPGGIAASCARAFSRNRPDVSISFINLADCITCSSLAVLHGDEAHSLITNAVKLIALHAEILRSQKSSLSLDELASDTEEMLALLTHILEEAVDTDASEPCYYGLSTILPIMSDVLLEIPRVGTPFFRFVTQLVCRFPDRLSRVPPDLRKHMLQSIDVQRKSADIIVERHALEAITALGRSRISDMKEGPGKDAVGEALRGFADSIFSGITTGSVHTSNLDAAADAFLPLMHTKSSQSGTVVEEFGQRLLESVGQNNEIRNALEELARAGGRAGSMYRYGASHLAVANRRSQVEATKSFREAFTSFSQETRNVLVSLALHGATM